ncbi:Putative glycosyltransferase EpsH [Rosistilla carotiformis]|uniref:Glycosyltransferase EpsH n=1 Tax=Rosistilla carotiformis TaxID=2528017 RepID=A0A518JVG4_9BACT|nr:glycosyltransferase [Rosistilla carotiformis]QDV69518.1 Putative glycosyltransferase EpsH [Rosistilla carotiformis]
MTSPTVSIIIPAYNVGRYIDDALQAALGQSLDDIEVVVVDDGSVDDTADRIQRVRDQRLKYVFQENAGQSAAINRGVAESSGDFIKLLDADDWIHPEHVAEQLAALDGHLDAIASCRWGYFTRDFRQPAGQPEHTNRSYRDPLRWLVDSLTIDQGMMGGWMWLIPRSVWEKSGGYDRRLSLNNDFHFSIALALAAESIQYAPSAVYSYRTGVAGALSGSQGRSAMESALLTTQLGTDLLLAREDSAEIRQLCADRFQQWLYLFYPEHLDLAEIATARIQQLGGSELPLRGGRAMQALLPVLGWRRVRRLQHWVYAHGWQRVLRAKARQRVSRFQ